MVNEPKAPSALETMRPARETARDPAGPIPALTVVHHPNTAMVGSRIRPARLCFGQAVSLSRLEPDFSRPDGRTVGPLASPFVSRRPLRLEPARGGVRLLPDSGASEVVVDGERLTEPRTFDDDALDRGVVLELGGEIVLLLHRLPELAAAGPDLGIVGHSPGMEAVRSAILSVADLAVPVLILGETGTGKELVARALHAASGRREQPFVSVNMAAITHTVAQSALFGHVRGAFTGAARDHAGYFGEASGGTIFLDEVGATSWEIQAMLLRVLETGEAQPVGSPRGRRVDVRLLAATDADLASAVEAGTFRRALYHRLSGYQIHVPPLRGRRDDIGRLLHHFLAMELEALGEGHRLSPADPGRPGYLSASLVGRLLRYGWPGNVRELHNVVRQLVVAGRGRARLGEADLGRILGEAPPAAPPEAPPVEVPRGPEPAAARSDVTAPAREAAAPGEPAAPRLPAEIDDALLLETLRRFDWRTSAAARHLGISRTTLYAMIERSPRIRAAKDVPDDELRRLYAECEGDVRCVARRLEVSERGLKLRLRRLGLGGRPGPPSEP